MTAFLLTKVGKIVAAFIGGTLLLLGIFFFGYSTAEKDNKADQIKEKLDTLEKAKEVQDELESLDPEQRARRLDGWLRD